MSYLSQINGRTIVDIYYSSSNGLRRAADMYNVVGSDLRKWVKDSPEWQPRIYDFIITEVENMKLLTEDGTQILAE